LLIPTDLTAISDRVIGRVALLPLSDRARLTLLHVVPKTLPHRAQRAAARDARETLAEEVTHLEKTLPKSVKVDSVVKVGVAASEIASRARAVKAELIVMGRGGGRALRDLFLGSTAERVIRRGQLPVLVVRLAPRAPYARPALALDLDEAAREVVTFVRQISPPGPPVTIIHASDPPGGIVYRGISKEAADEHIAQYRRRAVLKLKQLVTSALADAKLAQTDVPFWRIDVPSGSARGTIEKVVRRRKIDLLVLGTHGYSGLAHAFLGTVAGDVLRQVRCDVLVVPPRP
jgi:nucleotide-binding universal stress UspA family protein